MSQKLTTRNLRQVSVAGYYSLSSIRSTNAMKNGFCGRFSLQSCIALFEIQTNIYETTDRQNTHFCVAVALFESFRGSRKKSHLQYLSCGRWGTEMCAE